VALLRLNIEDSDPMIKTHTMSKSSRIIGACLLISAGFIYLSGCSMSDYRAPQAYPVNIIPIDSKFQGCAKSCLDEYSKCTAKQSSGYLNDLQNASITECRKNYKECMLTCRKTYKEIFN